jgi:2-polyprenyl-3-methyl-5-hydroxy-6-metoxy-1,4-benzoquinol methylase
MAGKVSTRELGLILGARLLKTEDLHYGFWAEDLEVRLANLAQAQGRYSHFLMNHIPAGVKSILDVGCGTGHLAQQLTARGYRVEAISPSPALTGLARARLGADVSIHPTTFEAFTGAGPFDLVLFAESFQYIRPRDSLPKALALLNAGGHVLIADFFLTDAPGTSALHGGHDLAGFYAYLATLPCQVVSDEDITAQTAPNLRLMDELLTDYALPIWETMGYWLREHHPWIAALGSRVFRRRLEKIRYKYFSHQRGAEQFARHKAYRVLLLKKQAATAPG